MSMLHLAMKDPSTAEWEQKPDGSWSCGNVEVRREVVKYEDRWFVWLSHEGQEHQKYHAPRNSNGYSTDEVAKNAAFLMSLSHRCR